MDYIPFRLLICFFLLLLFLMVFYAIIFCNIDMAGQCQTLRVVAKQKGKQTKLNQGPFKNEATIGPS